MNITSYTKAFKIAAVINGATPCNQLCNYSKLGYLIQENVLILIRYLYLFCYSQELCI